MYVSLLVTIVYYYDYYIYHVFPFVSVREMMGELFPTLESDLDAFLTYAEKQDGM